MRIDLRNDTETRQKLTYFAGRFSQELKSVIRQVGLKQQEAILDRTGDGKDVFGEPFEEYALMTKVLRDAGVKDRKTGKIKGGGLPIDKVDLNFTGNMLASMNVADKGIFRVQIGFAGVKEQDKATGHNEGKGRLPVREFFGASETDVNNIFRFINDKVDDIIGASA